MGRADGENGLPREELGAIPKLGRGELQAAAPGIGDIDPKHRQISPMVPTHERRAHAFQIGQGDAEFDRPGADHVSVGQHQPIGRKNHPGADAGGISPRAAFEHDFPHIDAHDRFKQLIKSPAHCRRCRQRQTAGVAQHERED